MKTRIALLLGTLALLTQLPAHADYLWLEPSSGSLNAYWGLYDGKRLDTSKLESARALLEDGSELPLTTAAGAWQVSAVAGKDARLTAQAVTAGNVLNFYQARFGRQGTKAVNDFELVPTEPNGTTFKLVWKGQVVAASQVNVTTSEGWIRILTPAEDGSVTLGTPFPGLYVLEVTARVNGSMSYQGKKYDDVRHTATLGFVVGPGAQTTDSQPEAGEHGAQH